MVDRLSELEGRVAALAESQRQLDGRIEALERRAARAPLRAVAASPAAAVPPGGRAAAARDPAATTRTVTLLGRTLLVLAGGFLLRAVTESGAVPVWAGVSAGFAYAALWIVLADRAAPREPWSAGFHGASAVVIALPLVLEATTRFRLLAPASASAVLAAFTAAAFAVAARRRQLALAWIVEIAAVLAALALAIATGRLAPPLLVIVGLGVAALWAGYVLDWFHLRWPVAAVADLLLVVLALRAIGPAATEGPGTALLVQVAAMALFLGSVATRTLLLDRPVVAFEIAQTAALVAAGLGGAAYVTVRSGTGEAVLGAVSVAFGVAAYAVAFAFLERRKGGRANFHLYSSVALVFVLAGTALVLPGRSLAAGWAALAVATAALARATRRSTLAAHAAVYSVMAALQSGLLAYGARTLLASPAEPWPPPSLAALLALGALGAAAALTARDSAGVRGWARRVPRCVLVATLAASAAGVLAGWAVPLAAGTPGHGASAGAAAAARTGVLVAGVLALAWVGRLEQWREASWLTFPLLGATGLKLVLEDLGHSRPASLFLSFALYGAALILVPRLRRRGAPRTAAAVSASPSP